MSNATSMFHGVEIPEALIATELQNHSAPGLAEARALAGRALAAKAVLLARGAALELNPETERNADGQEETADEAMIRSVLSEEVEVEPPSEADLRGIYDANPDGFRSPPLIEASHILIAPEDDSEGAGLVARQKAVELIADLLSQPGQFERMAAKLSACPSAAEGGSLGQLRPGDVLSGIWSALDGLSVGEIGSSPIETEYGWHVLRLDHMADGERLPFEHVRPHISAQIEARAWTIAAARYVDELLNASTAEPMLVLNEHGGLATSSNGAAQATSLLGSVLASESHALEQLSEGSRAIVTAAAKTQGLDPSQILRGAITDFLTKANDEAWTQIISRLRDGAEPLRECLDVIVTEQLPPLRTKRTLILTRSSNRAAPEEKGDRHGTG